METGPVNSKEGFSCMATSGDVCLALIQYRDFAGGLFRFVVWFVLFCLWNNDLRFNTE